MTLIKLLIRASSDLTITMKIGIELWSGFIRNEEFSIYKPRKKKKSSIPDTEFNLFSSKIFVGRISFVSNPTSRAFLGTECSSLKSHYSRISVSRVCSTLLSTRFLWCSAAFASMHLSQTLLYVPVVISTISSPYHLTSWREIRQSMINQKHANIV